MTAAGPATLTAPGASPTAAGGAPVLRADSVAVVREGRRILDGVSLTVGAGEHWALLGANGAGKSTLLGLLGALTHPTHGTVDVLGSRLGTVDLRELRAHLGHVDPRHPLRSPLPVREVVLTGLTNSVARMPHRHPSPAQRARAEALIGAMGLAARADARWPTLSQGERGRALIARALMPGPRLLLLDEPATGLDLPGRERLLDSLEALRTAHPRLATVLVTHHLEELPVGTTHAVLLREGRVLASGAVRDVVTTELISACFDHPVRVERREGRWSVRGLRGAGA
ncbi:ABC transporter ATP-binding protein [Streptomyces spectabilis]|uniref:ATP-binding cassette domain-containing protein n=1 Tax=Streptomyces spectabilis TaxID=68270 RepID=A0A5P2XH02_STRST|nr:ATP-binding cassette domain-containing protein [Streptomyces spectabilis]MBB5104369.1 iron complex transport system ATP-binding protein [Streptomyces spectabilis]MCI3905272.1 ATP-binding cassette domain-containing protein [Streptomyces spectabilis]QEV62280.1 ATP-binding cassette domain-containing protein [Streptomyces spectabilis]GGU99535.1 ABC transporter ATP-binding protein [Streptomyces spectabilis]